MVSTGDVFKADTFLIGTPPPHPSKISRAHTTADTATFVCQHLCVVATPSRTRPPGSTGAHAATGVIAIGVQGVDLWLLVVLSPD